ncbi:MAG: c-type cytochrome [Sphingomonadaceae bacterium]|nr:c-type cytochrome [Sphingomonadaceae bacterium]
MRRLIPLLLLALAACQSNDPRAQAKALIASRCAACHVVPGVRTAVGVVGPSLADIANRQVIAGKFANNRDNLIRWIMHPQAMMPGSAMPEMGISQPQATQIADYLRTLDKP